MSKLELFLLGLPRVVVQNKQVHLGRRKATALLAYLAVTKRVHSRESLSTFFWPDYGQSQALAYLRRVLSELNKSLGDSLLTIDRETVRINQSSLWQDVDEFHQNLRESSTHNHPVSEVCTKCIPHLEDAVKLYRGDFLEGFTLRDSPAFDEWQFFKVENLKRELSSTLERLVHWYYIRENYQPAISFAQRWLALDQLHEPAHLSLMRLYSATGQKSIALRQYQLCKQALRDELDAVPNEATTALFNEIRASSSVKVGSLLVKTDTRQAISDSQPPRNNLPAQLTSFIGR